MTCSGEESNGKTHRNELIDLPYVIVYLFYSKLLLDNYQDSALSMTSCYLETTLMRLWASTRCEFLLCYHIYSPYSLSISLKAPAQLYSVRRSRMSPLRLQYERKFVPPSLDDTPFRYAGPSVFGQVMDGFGGDRHLVLAASKGE